MLGYGDKLIYRFDNRCRTFCRKYYEKKIEVCHRRSYKAVFARKNLGYHNRIRNGVVNFHKHVVTDEKLILVTLESTLGTAHDTLAAASYIVKTAKSLNYLSTKFLYQSFSSFIFVCPARLN